MNKSAFLLLSLAVVLVTTGTLMMAIPAGLITAGVLSGVIGVLFLTVGERRTTKDGKSAK